MYYNVVTAAQPGIQHKIEKYSHISHLCVKATLTFACSEWHWYHLFKYTIYRNLYYTLLAVNINES